MIKRRKPYRKTDRICANCKFYDMENHKCEKDGAGRDVKSFCSELKMRPRTRDWGIGVCPVCGKEYKRNANDQTFCSLSCARQSRIGIQRTAREVRHCELCNAPFEVRVTSKRRYCTKSCWYASDEEKNLLRNARKIHGEESTGTEVLVTNLNTRRERFFPSIKLAAEYAGINYNLLRHQMKKEPFVMNGCKFELTGL